MTEVGFVVEEVGVAVEGHSRILYCSGEEADSLGHFDTEVRAEDLGLADDLLQAGEEVTEDHRPHDLVCSFLETVLG